jgi:hypothetical protein
VHKIGRTIGIDVGKDGKFEDELRKLGGEIGNETISVILRPPRIPPAVELDSSADAN